jgi:hypothetical protein
VFQSRARAWPDAALCISNAAMASTMCAFLYRAI